MTLVLEYFWKKSTHILPCYVNFLAYLCYVNFLAYFLHVMLTSWWLQEGTPILRVKFHDVILFFHFPF